MRLARTTSGIQTAHNKGDARSPVVAAQVDLAKPTSMERFTYPEFGKTHSIEFSPYGDIGGAETDKAVLLIQPSTGSILATIPLFDINRTAPVAFEFSPTHVRVDQWNQWNFFGEKARHTVHDAVTGLVTPGANQSPQATGALSQNGLQAADDFASAVKPERPSVDSVLRNAQLRLAARAADLGVMPVVGGEVPKS